MCAGDGSPPAAIARPGPRSPAATTATAIRVVRCENRNASHASGIVNSIGSTSTSAEGHGASTNQDEKRDQGTRNHPALPPLRGVLRRRRKAHQRAEHRRPHGHDGQHGGEPPKSEVRRRDRRARGVGVRCAAEQRARRDTDEKRHDPERREHRLVSSLALQSIRMPVPMAAGPAAVSMLANAKPEPARQVAGGQSAEPAQRGIREQIAADHDQRQRRPAADRTGA